MEFHYPKDYKTERTEADEMRSKSIREYYEKEAIKKEKNQHTFLIIVVSLVLILLILKLIKFI